MRFVCLVIVCACTPTPTRSYQLGVTASTVAVGARATVSFWSDPCDDIGCTAIPDEVLSIAFDPPDVFDLAEPGLQTTGFDVVATGEGVTTMTLEVRGHGETHSLVHTIAALPVDRIAITPMLGGTPCELPALFSAGMTAKLPVEMFHGDERLQGARFAPFLVDRGVIDSTRSDTRSLFLTLPATEGPVVVTSTADATFSLAIDAFAPPSLDGIVLTPADSSVAISGRVDVDIDLFVGGRRVCADSVERTVMTDTPELCCFEQNVRTAFAVLGPGINGFKVRGLSPGTCVVRVDARGTGLSASASFEVTM